MIPTRFVVSVLPLSTGSHRLMRCCMLYAGIISWFPFDTIVIICSHCDCTLTVLSLWKSRAVFPQQPSLQLLGRPGRSKAHLLHTTQSLQPGAIPLCCLLSKESFPGLVDASNGDGAVFCWQLLLSFLSSPHICRFGFRSLAAAGWEHIPGKCSVSRDFTP